MRKHLVLSLLVLATVSGFIKADDPGCNGDVFGHTFFWVRPPFQTAMPEKETMFRDRAYAREDDCAWCGAVQFVPFGGRSTKSKDLMKFFAPCPKTELAVRQYADPAFQNIGRDPARDINPIHFNVLYNTGGTVGAGTYSSTLKFRPRQTFYGFGFTWTNYFGRGDCECKHWWGQISFPVLHVRNDMNLTEENREVDGNLADDRAANMEVGFKGNTRFNSSDNGIMKFGKIDGSRKKTGVADIELKLGYDWVNTECCHFDSYLGILIPTGNKPDGEYVFEPIVGHGKHFGVMWGSDGGFQLWEECERTLYFEYQVNTRYLFKKTQRRSFDLKNRAWSRYLLMYENEAAADAAGTGTTGILNVLANATPGINILTRDVRVQPRYYFNMLGGLVYDSCNFRGEIGYNFYAKQSEKVCLKEAWEEGPVVANITNVMDDSTLVVNLLSNISNDNPGAAVEYNEANRIKRSDLDLTSAAMPAGLSHIVYLSLGWHNDDWCYPTFFGVGASYEFSGMNTILNRWTVWGKFGFSL